MMTFPNIWIIQMFQSTNQIFILISWYLWHLVWHSILAFWHSIWHSLCSGPGTAHGAHSFWSSRYEVRVQAQPRASKARKKHETLQIFPDVSHKKRETLWIFLVLYQKKHGMFWIFLGRKNGTFWMLIRRKIWSIQTFPCNWHYVMLTMFQWIGVIGYIDHARIGVQ